MTGPQWAKPGQFAIVRGNEVMTVGDTADKLNTSEMYLQTARRFADGWVRNQGGAVGIYRLVETLEVDGIKTTPAEAGK